MSSRLRDAFEDELIKLANAGLLSRVGGSVANFGRRTMHGLTGGFAHDAASAARIGLDPALHAQGVTSIPGVVRGLSDARTRSQTIKSLGRATLGGGGALNTAMAAAPVVMAVPELARGDESALGGRSVKQKLTNLGLNVGANVATAGLPLGANLATGLGSGMLINKLTQPGTV